MVETSQTPSTLVSVIYKNDVQLVTRSIFIYTFELNSMQICFISIGMERKDGSFQYFQEGSRDFV